MVLCRASPPPPTPVCAQNKKSFYKKCALAPQRVLAHSGPCAAHDARQEAVRRRQEIREGAPQGWQGASVLHLDLCISMCTCMCTHMHVHTLCTPHAGPCLCTVASIPAFPWLQCALLCLACLCSCLYTCRCSCLSTFPCTYPCTCLCTCPGLLALHARTHGLKGVCMYGSMHVFASVVYHISGILV